MFPKVSQKRENDSKSIPEKSKCFQKYPRKDKMIPKVSQKRENDSKSIPEKRKCFQKPKLFFQFS